MGVYQTNCCVAYDADGSCAVIDPCDLGDKIYSFIKSQGLSLKAVFITHAHFDHILGLTELIESAVKDGLCIPVYIYSIDLPAMGDKYKNLSAQMLSCTSFEYGGELTAVSDGKEISVGKITFKVMHTPGHTPGSMCLVCEADGIIFSGDTLFEGSCGRTDFEGGSDVDMKSSLQRLKALSGDYRIIPGHGPETTLCAERVRNPYMQ